MKKNFWKGIVLITLALVLLAGCGKKEEAPAEAKLEGPLTIWSFLVQPPRADAFAALATEFNATHPGVNAEIIVSPWTGAVDKLVAAVMAGNPPDLSIIGAGYTQVLHGIGGLEEIGSLVEEMGGQDLFFQSSLDAGLCVDGKYYAVPVYVTPDVTFYRQSWLDEAGITKLPTTWQEYYDMCKAVTDPSRERYGFGMPLHDHHGFKTIWGSFLTFGIDVVNVDANGKWYVDMPADKRAEAERVYEYFYRLVKECSPPGAVGYDVNNIRELQAKGVIMSTLSTPEAYFQVRDLAPDTIDDVKYFVFPGPTVDQPSGFNPGWTALGIFKKGNVALSREFIKFIYEGERFIPFFNSYPYAMFPAKQDFFASAQYRDNLPKELQPLLPDMALEILGRSATVLSTNGPFPNAAEIEPRKTFTNPLTNMLVNGITAKQAVDQFVAEMEELVR